MTAAETVQEAAEVRVPLINQWLAEGKYTCTIREFSRLYSISYDHARELCKSRNAPPGFYSGRNYKILLESLPAYMSDFARKHRSVGA